jgi:predicted dehydrogenase
VVDKPFTLTVAEGIELTELAERQGRPLSVFHNRRWDADFLVLKGLLAEGRLGRVVRFESRFDRYRPVVRDRWRESAAPGSGVWFDLGPHLIDQALQLFGPPQAITCDLAAMREGAVSVDYAHAELRYPGLRVSLHADMLSPASEVRFAVHGDRASFLKTGLDVQEAQLIAGFEPGAPGWGEDPNPGMLVDGASGARTTLLGPAGDYRMFYDGVAAALRSEGRNPAPAREAVQVMSVLEAGVLSSAERREVAL